MAKSDAEKARELISKVQDGLNIAEHYLATGFEIVQNFVEKVYNNIEDEQAPQEPDAESGGTDKSSPQYKYDYLLSKSTGWVNQMYVDQKDLLLSDEGVAILDRLYTATVEAHQNVGPFSQN